MDCQQKAHQHLAVGEYEQSALLFEQFLENNPDQMSCYWYLGLSQILNDDDASAQSTWLYGMAQGNESQINEWTQELAEILALAAANQAELKNFDKSYLLRLHLNEILPGNLNNLLHLVELEMASGNFQPEILQQIQLNHNLNQASLSSSTIGLLLEILPKILIYPIQDSLELAEISYQHIHSKQLWSQTLVSAAMKASHNLNQHDYAINLIQVCLKFVPNQILALENLPKLYMKAKQYQEAISAAKSYLSQCNNLPMQTIGNGLYLDTLMHAGHWEAAFPIYEKQKKNLAQLVDENPKNLPLSVIENLIVKTSLLSYLQDKPEESRRLQNQVARLFLDNITANTNVNLPLYRSQPNKANQRLRIGYIGNTFKQHSVGWICRWLFQYHDRNKFDIKIYTPTLHSDNSFFQTWFASKVDSFFEVDADIQGLAERISKDQVDILIDLDSATLDYTCLVMALKPAPIQVTWLGLDATGIPTIDYFLADPYVLPENANQYYKEKIWRLPQTYVAVDGFEVDVPTLRRDELGIPADAVVYLSAQSGLKRYPDTIRLQLKIIQGVTNSYFLVKGLANNLAIQELFLNIAKEEGVPSDRLKFLPLDSSEYVHRANLRIADIVLDTYPYNGATTTLETLWMGIPIVTRVGKQFAARNSYAFMTNVGVTEGIAWTDDEYIEWGIRLGKDLELRQDISLRLRRSRHDSPLWNTEKFTRQLETAYLEMWKTYTGLR